MTLRASFAALAAILLMGTAAACTSDSGDHGNQWVAPLKGQAVQLLDFSDGGRDAKAKDVAFYGLSGMSKGMTSGADGSTYALGQKLVRLKRDRTVSTPLDTGGSAWGVVVLADNSLIFGSNGQVKKISSQGKVTVLAGVSGKQRAAGQALPASVPATAVHFTANASPFGVRPDGTILIADGNALWALKDATVKRLYQVTAKSPDGLPLLLAQNNAMDGTGTAYLSPESSGTDVDGALGDVVSVGPDGRLGKLLLPAKVSGLPGAPATYRVRWLAGDGSNGVFAHVYDKSGNNGAVIHLHSGEAELIAHEGADATSSKPCSITRPVDALHLPCILPQAMTYRSGSLILGGLANYVLQIRVA
ncbi:hypothetical protein AQI95_07035 [Streptomyces yokosukanensis]|uniref:Uncharacterized protein n=1 Tax=Streptomyces yokosukanensis TaxID=67386 RepID=A0A117Q533_9ACTN|nr:hypothetical protein [Streptomyces yokosukanensis]KUN08758.1 hypothetical protein AQI95_07035 [Streptomyces yokosukanensis]